MIGTIVNTGAVIVGSLIGLVLHKHLPQRFINAAFSAMGLFTLFIGVKMALMSENVVILVLSIISGAILGEFLRLEERLENTVDRIKTRVGSKDSRFTEGLMTAFLLWCMGSMTILGALDEGLRGIPDLLFAKSVLDGFASIALAASMGVGVLFAAIPLFLYQGGITLSASLMSSFLNESVINELAAVGGLMLLGLGLNILGITKIKTLNLIPALVVAIVLTILWPATF